MFRKIILLSIFPFVFACQQKQKDDAKDNQDSSAIVLDGPTENTSLTNSPENKENHTSAINYKQGDLLLANASYRIGEENEIGKILNHGTWFMLRKDQKGYKVEKAQYKLINAEEEPCSGLPTQTLESDRSSLLFFNIPTIKIGTVDTIAIEYKNIAPNKSQSFVFNGHSYTLEAKGIDPLKQDYSSTANAFYQLILTVDNISQEILYQTEYNDTHTEILFIGDLDKDGKLDFMLSSPRDYEEERIILILSSDPIHYEETRQFDC